MAQPGTAQDCYCSEQEGISLNEAQFLAEILSLWDSRQLLRKVGSKDSWPEPRLDDSHREGWEIQMEDKNLRKVRAVALYLK